MCWNTNSRTAGALINQTLWMISLWSLNLIKSKSKEEMNEAKRSAPHVDSVWCRWGENNLLQNRVRLCGVIRRHKIIIHHVTTLSSQSWAIYSEYCFIQDENLDPFKRNAGRRYFRFYYSCDVRAVVRSTLWDPARRVRQYCSVLTNGHLMSSFLCQNVFSSPWKHIAG
jgi:hypothetical protein